MTETLPVTDVTIAQIEQARVEAAQSDTGGDGVCVGRPVDDVVVGISRLDSFGSPTNPPEDAVGVTGEVCVQAAHGKERYDRLWITDADATRDVGWHRTGDVGHLDDQGRLWIEGRLGDVARTAAGPVTPVPLEQRILALRGHRGRCDRGGRPIGIAAVGRRRGRATNAPPRGPMRAVRRWARRPVTALRLAELGFADAVRSAVPVPLAAVLLATTLPVDIRHNSKIDHPLLAARAGSLLAGHQPGRFSKHRFPKPLHPHSGSRP